MGKKPAELMLGLCQRRMSEELAVPGSIISALCSAGGGSAHVARGCYETWRNMQEAYNCMAEDAARRRRRRRRDEQNEIRRTWYEPRAMAGGAFSL